MQSREPINSTHMTPDLGIEPGPHWWEASALTTAPSLHPRQKRVGQKVTKAINTLISQEYNTLYVKVKILRQWF